MMGRFDAVAKSILTRVLRIRGYFRHLLKRLTVLSATILYLFAVVGLLGLMLYAALSSRPGLPWLLRVILIVVGLIGTVTMFRRVSPVLSTLLSHVKGAQIIPPRGPHTVNSSQCGLTRLLTWDADGSDPRRRSASYSQEVNQRLAAGIEIDLYSSAATPYEAGQVASAAIGSVLSNRRGGISINMKKVRLLDDSPLWKSTRNPIPLPVQMCRYWDVLVTNDLVGSCITWNDETLLVSEYLADRSDNAWVVRPLSASQCANSIGVNAVAISNDGFLLMGKQTTGSWVNPGEAVPGGSGSMDWRDLERYQAGHVTRATERELVEECLKRQTLRALPTIRTRLIGYARFLHRGGKPEFFGVCYVDLPRKAFRIRKMELPYQEDLIAKDVGEDPKGMTLESLKGVVTYLKEAARVGDVSVDGGRCFRKILAFRWG